MYSGETNQKKTVNRLANEKSPYLIQHKNNPVDWYPWGKEAFEKAKKENKPVFLSIGYATCHWCHVMAHESFEDEEVAQLLNKYFVSIKVDREERPDIDNIYMTVCQSLTGSGGWPLSIFMTPEAEPFYAGTYFPKVGRMGIPGLMDTLKKIATLWEKDSGQLIEVGEKITEHINFKPAPRKPSSTLGSDTLKKGFEQLKSSFDPKNGGFGSSPKFPTPHQLTFLLRWYKRSADSSALEMVEKTLLGMRRGGIFDQIGFGFHRYSVDAEWLVPHFEKMLYDQALLAMAYIEAFQVTGKDAFSRTAKEIFAYVLRDMTAPEGGFYSAEDADSEGKEGQFYLWTPSEIERQLGEELGKRISKFYDVTKSGNFEGGHSIPHVPVSHRIFAEKEGIDLAKFEKTLENARERLFQERKGRIHPLKDDKILTSWNGLMIAALAKGSRVLGNQAYANAAKGAADFILKSLKMKDGRLLRRYRQGDADYPGYLDDYAFMVWGLIELYEATFEVSYLEEAIALNKAMVDIYWDEKEGGFYFTGEGNETLITRSKEIYDGALPSGNSVAALNLLRLGRMTGNVDFEQMAEQLINVFAAQVISYPSGYSQLLVAIDFIVGPGQEIVIAGDPSTKATQKMLRTVHRKFLPHNVLLFKRNGPEGKRLTSISPFVEAMTPLNQQATAYVCKQYACQTPITNISELEAILK
ncbi:MAG: thioredoxin domain-containing protein [Deltaproteobacteria bacterium]|nr:thioredoxin domain-containing protein [Deltaproteobacteria bacterium]